MSRYNDNFGQYSGQQNYDSPNAYPRENLYPPQTNFNDFSSTDSLDRNYDSAPGEKYASNPGYPVETKKGHAKRWWIIGGIVVLLLAAGGGIAAWRVTAAKNNSASASSSGGATSGPTDAAGFAYMRGSANAVKVKAGDMTQFQKDPRLHQAFYGLAYVPFNAQEPSCGAVQANVTEDLMIMSQLTTRIRMYGAACNQSRMMMQAIRETKVNMSVYLGVYIGTNEAVNRQQMQYTLDVLGDYAAEVRAGRVLGVIVGNEYILGRLPANRLAAVDYLIVQQRTFREALKGLNLPIVIPVGTADAGSVITTRLAEGSDFVMANVHAFFGGLPVAQAAAWTQTYFVENDVAAVNAARNKPPVYIAETGWPTESMTAANATYQAAVSGIPQLQNFLDTFVCQANTNGTKYFYFETFDEPWKEVFGGVEPYWGLMNSNKALKNVRLPTCISP